MNKNVAGLPKNIMILSNLITAKVSLVTGIFLGLGICYLNKKIMGKQDINKENESSFNEK